MDKNKINNYLEMKKEWYIKRLNESKALDDACAGKDMFIEAESQCLNLLNEIEAFINSGLAE